MKFLFGKLLGRGSEKRTDPKDAAASEKEKTQGRTQAPTSAPTRAPMPIIHARPAPPPAKPAPPPPEKEPDEEIVFSLGDFLGRIPEYMRAEGPLDLGIPVRFELSELSSRIARGHTTISLVDLYKRVPEAFCEPVEADNTIEVRFPWQRLLAMVRGDTRESAPPSADPSANPAPAAPAASAPPAAPAPGEPGAPATLLEKMRLRAKNVALTTATSEVHQNLASLRQSIAEPSAVPLRPPPAKPEERPAQPSWYSAPTRAADPTQNAKSETNKIPKSSSLNVLPPLPSANSSAQAADRGSGPAGGEPVPEAIPDREGSEGKVPGPEADEMTESDPGQNSSAVGETRMVDADIANERSPSPDGDTTLEVESGNNSNAGLHPALLEETKETVETLPNEASAVNGSDAVTKELAEARAELTRLRGEWERRADPARLEHLEKENTRLTEQILQMSNRVGPNGPTGSGLLGSGGDRSRIERRIVDDLNRRIVALEGSQREAAQELTRERENRIKTERSLNAAERARQEASAMVDTIRAESRREVEATRNKREIEFARQQKELQDRLDAAAALAAKLQAERDDAQAKLAGLEAQGGEGMPIAKAPALVPSLPDADEKSEWESRALEAMEADLESYRQRIKVVLAERNALLAEKNQAEQNREGQSKTGDIGGASSEELARALARVESQAAELIKLKEALAQSESTDNQRGQVEVEVSRLRSQITQIKSEHQAAIDLLNADLESAKRAKLEAEKLAEALRTGSQADAALKAEVVRITRELESARGSSNTSITGLRNDVRRISQERDQAREEASRIHYGVEEQRIKANQATAALQKLQTDFTSLEARAQTLEKDLDEAKNAIQALSREKAQVIKERDALAESLAKHQADAAARITALSGERDQSYQLRESARQEFESLLASAEQQITSLRAELTSARAASSAEKSAMLQTHDASILILQEDLRKVRENRDECIEERDLALAKAKKLSEDLAAARQTFERDALDLRAQLATADKRAASDKAAAVGALQKTLDALTLEVAESRATRDRLDAQVLELEARVSALVSERDALTEKSEGLEESLGFATTERDDVRATVHVLEARIAEQANEVKAREEDLARVKREAEQALATAHAEREKGIAVANAEKMKALQALAKDKEELIATLASEREKSLKDLAALENDLRIQMAGTTVERDEARSECDALAQHFAEQRLVLDKRVQELETDREQLLAEKRSLATELEAARETFKAQSAVFAREFKSVVRQRDEALAGTEGARKGLEQKTLALEQERLSVAQQVEDVKARFEREISRMRKERDSIIQQRDELRTRLERFLDDQRAVLHEMGTQPRSTTRTPSESSVKPRESRSENVIEISTAEVISTPVSPAPDFLRQNEAGVRPQQVRPVSVPPPHVQAS